MGRKVLLSSFLRVFAKFAQPKHARLGRGEDTRPFSSLRVCVQLAAGAESVTVPKCSRLDDGRAERSATRKTPTSSCEVAVGRLELDARVSSLISKTRRVLQLRIALAACTG